MYRLYDPDKKKYMSSDLKGWVEKKEKAKVWNWRPAAIEFANDQFEPEQVKRLLIAVG